MGETIKEKAIEAKKRTLLVIVLVAGDQHMRLVAIADGNVFQLWNGHGVHTYDYELIEDIRFVGEPDSPVVADLKEAQAGGYRVKVGFVGYTITGFVTTAHSKGFFFREAGEGGECGYEYRAVLSVERSEQRSELTTLIGVFKGVLEKAMSQSRVVLVDFRDGLESIVGEVAEIDEACFRIADNRWMKYEDVTDILVKNSRPDDPPDVAKGRWEAHQDGPNLLIRDTDGLHLARVVNATPEQIRVMIRAPQMLEALEMALPYLPGKVSDLAVTAIKKARDGDG